MHFIRLKPATRWLLRMHDLAGEYELHLTQDFFFGISNIASIWRPTPGA
jgi:hypothetical protein